MSESDSEPGGVSDEELPEDVRPGEDNPLAEPLEDDVDVDDLDMDGGKTAEESEDDSGGDDGEDDGEEDGASEVSDDEE